MEDVSVYFGLGGAVIVAALVQVVKQTIGLTDEKWTRFIPITSIVLGIGWNALIASMAASPATWQMVVFLGLFSGLAASGLYSGSKATMRK